MIDVQALITEDGRIDRDLLHLEIIKYVTTGIGYDLPEGRLMRIAADTRAFMHAGLPFAYSYSQALDVELLLFGDPKAPEQHFMPILIEKL